MHTDFRGEGPTRDVSSHRRMFDGSLPGTSETEYVLQVDPFTESVGSS